MAWSDEPSDAQVAAWGNLVQWRITSAERAEGAKWIRNHATRKELSDDLTRLRELYIKRKLTRDLVFKAGFWDGFPPALGAAE